MNIDPSAVWQAILQSIQTPSSVGDGMRGIIAVCSSQFPHRDWQRFADLDFEADVSEHRNWIQRALSREPSPFPIRGLYFGLFNPIRDGHTTADIRVSGTDHYDPITEWEWISSDRRHVLRDDSAHSTALASIYGIAYGTDSGLGNDAEWPLALAYAALFVRALLTPETTAVIGTTAETVGVVVGFDSGDLLRVGELKKTGFNVLT